MPDVLDAFLESNGDRVYVVDDADRVVYANRAALDVLGYADESRTVFLLRWASPAP